MTRQPNDTTPITTVSNERTVMLRILELTFRGIVLIFLGTVGISCVYGLAKLMNDSSMVAQSTTVELITSSLVVLVTFTLGYLITRKHPNHMIAFLFLVVAYLSGLNIILISVSLMNSATGIESSQLLSILEFVKNALAFPVLLILIILVPLYFPTGKLLGKRWRIVPIMTVVAMTIFGGSAIFVPDPFNALGLGEALPRNNILMVETVVYPVLRIVGFGLVPLLFLAGIISFGLRYRRAVGTERKQMQWPLFGMVVLMCLSLSLPPLTGLVVRHEISELLGQLIFWLATIVFPSTIGIAILRHHLFDIDVIIRRTLIYTVVSVILLAVYGGMVLTAQTFLTGLLDTDNALLIVVSTLAVAALFNPVLKRVQAVIDRFFYRKRYDTNVTLEQFSDNIRDATDASVIEQQLLTTVEHTIQPEHISLWVVNKSSKV